MDINSPCLEAVWLIAVRFSCSDNGATGPRPAPQSGRRRHFQNMRAGLRGLGLLSLHQVLFPHPSILSMHFVYVHCGYQFIPNHKCGRVLQVNDKLQNMLPPVAPVLRDPAARNLLEQRGFEDIDMPDIRYSISQRVSNVLLCI